MTHLNSERKYTDELMRLLPIASLLWLAMTVLIAGALTPGYSHVSQYMSELGATGAPYGRWVNYFGFLPTQVLMLGFVVLALLRKRYSRAQLVGFVFIGIYALALGIGALQPCDKGCRPDEPTISQYVHSISGLVGYAAALFGVLQLALSQRLRRRRQLMVFGIAVSAFGFFAASITFSESEIVGLTQRSMEFGIYLWLIFYANELSRDARNLDRLRREA